MTRRQILSSADQPPISCDPHSPDSASGEYNAGVPRPEHPPGIPTVLDDIDAEAMARRRLLKLAAYSVPLVVGTLIAGPADAGLSADDTGCLNSNPGSNPNCD